MPQSQEQEDLQRLRYQQLFPRGIQATSIGPPEVGTRLLPTGAPESLWDLVKSFIGQDRPLSVQSQDPYGILGWERGAGDIPAGALNTGMTRVPPSELPALRAAGKALLEKIEREGLETRMLGQRKHTEEAGKAYAEAIRNWKAGERMPMREDFEFKPNVSFGPESQEALEGLRYAQRRYPRIFGHMSDIADVDTYAVVQSGGAIKGSTHEDRARKGFSKLGLNIGGTYTYPREYPDAETVGHELLHVADQIRYPDFTERYDASLKLPSIGSMTPYKGSSYEVRARQAGERFANKMKGIPNEQPISLEEAERILGFEERGPNPFRIKSSDPWKIVNRPEKK